MLNVALRYMVSLNALWVRVVKAIYGDMSLIDEPSRRSYPSSVWVNVIKAIESNKEHSVDLLGYCSMKVQGTKTDSIRHRPRDGVESEQSTTMKTLISGRIAIDKEILIMNDAPTRWCKFVTKKVTVVVHEGAYAQHRRTPLRIPDLILQSCLHSMGRTNFLLHHSKFGGTSYTTPAWAILPIPQHWRRCSSDPTDLYSPLLSVLVFAFDPFFLPDFPDLLGLEGVLLREKLLWFFLMARVWLRVLIVPEDPLDDRFEKFLALELSWLLERGLHGPVGRERRAFLIGITSPTDDTNVEANLRGPLGLSKRASNLKVVLFSLAPSEVAPLTCIVIIGTPLWRNGPPDKPVLCNACGSRWRTKGSLVNYTPLHARAEPDDFEDRRVARVKTISIKNKEAKILKRKQNYDNVVGGSANIMLGSGSGGGGVIYDHQTQGFRKVFDEDTSNRSSSGSAISNSDGYMQLGSGDASDLTGQAQSSVVWDTMVPSRKRTCVSRGLKQSPVEKLTRDLHTILHEQRSYFSGSSEEDLIFECNTPMVSVEIGHGSVLMRHPSSTREEESEASSLSVDTKNEAYSQLTTFPVYNANKGGNFSSRRNDASKKIVNQDHVKRDNDEKLQLLMNQTSQLCNIDLKDVINFEEFTSHLTNDEQQQLQKYLSLVDTDQVPDSLKSMFDSPQFKENLLSFQKLLAEGAFDLSSPMVKNEGGRTLMKLSLGSATKADWVEKYNLLQDAKCKYDIGGSVIGGIQNSVTPGHSVNVKKSQDAQFQPYQ
ncbi:GATA transcription factor 26-like protein, partial [Tanacetum coccineum]